MPGSQAKQQRSRISLERASDREFARHILTFDSDRPETYSTRTIASAGRHAGGCQVAHPVACRTSSDAVADQPAPNPSAELSQYDYLIVTWTVEEGKCLADTLTPGYSERKRLV